MASFYGFEVQINYTLTHDLQAGQLDYVIYIYLALPNCSHMCFVCISEMNHKHIF